MFAISRLTTLQHDERICLFAYLRFPGVIMDAMFSDPHLVLQTYIPTTPHSLRATLDSISFLNFLRTLLTPDDGHNTTDGHDLI